MTSMDTVQVMESTNSKTQNALQGVKGRSDTLKILDRQRIRGGLTKLNQSDDESIDDTTTYVGTANGEEMGLERDTLEHHGNDGDDTHTNGDDLDMEPLRRQETKLDSQTLERVRKRIMTGNKKEQRAIQRPMRVYRRPRDDSDEYSKLVQRTKMTQNVIKDGGGRSGPRHGDSDGDDSGSSGTDSQSEEEEAVSTSSERDEFDDSLQSRDRNKRGRVTAHQKMSTVIRHPTASRLDCLKDIAIEQRSSDTEFEEIDEERPLRRGAHHEKGQSVSGRGIVLSPVSALSHIKSRLSQLSDLSGPPVKSGNLGNSSMEIQGLINM